MAPEHSIKNGSQFSNSHSGTLLVTGGQLIRSHGLGDSVYFDARVHSTPVEAANSTVTVLLRRNGEFIDALLEPNSTNASSFDAVQSLTTESLVRVSGSILLDGQHATKRDSLKVATIHVSKLIALSEAKADIFKTTTYHGGPSENSTMSEVRLAPIEERLNNRLLDTRVAANAAIFKLFSGVHEVAVEYLAAHDFHYIPTPAFISYEYPGEESDHFAVPYFDQTAWLAPTSEVHLGMALSADLGRVYDIHTVFRREAGVDGRHLTEFTMLELVFALQHSWTEIIDLADGLLVHLVRSLQEHEKYKTLTQQAQQCHPLAGDFKLGLDDHGKLKRVRFSEAKAILRNALGLEADDNVDFTREEEAALGRHISSDESCLGSPADLFIITHFPNHLRACNIHPAQDGDLTHSFDVILRGQECVTGCQLIHSHDELRTAFATRVPPINSDSPGWRPFVAAHEIGMPPWGGFGLGLNRFVQGFLGLADIRESILFPRDASRLAP